MALEKPKLLVDANCCGIAPELRKQGYDVESVCELVNAGEPMKYDISVFLYAQKTGRMIITKDEALCGGCRENGCKCIFIPPHKHVSGVNHKKEVKDHQLKCVMEGLK